ncbi:MAG TPA: DUF1015 domain-containing protein [Euryarchaeota archaeon]|nr:MAG: hypothetical protein B6U90_00350 [Thermoplasmatales archaeon ex4484_6]RLF68987.1 MAG: hypothetical protein DRN57_02215 [Thermoplasmata archaeon]HHD16808.1 DUF1015 domain-containing protein [Euryarchaeota archaeon]
MVRVVPFRAYRYDREKVGDLSKVVSPPYDVIKGERLDRVQSLSPYNISWITKNKPRPDDTGENNQYTRARDLLNEWMEEGILKREETDCFYVYSQDFTVEDRTLSRFGFIGLLELEEFATSAPEEGPFTGILQHEETLPKDIEDRLNLSRQTLAQFGQIFVIYPDAEGEVDSVLQRSMDGEPVMDVKDQEGIRHRLWKVDSDSDKEAISRAMESKYAIIADGHHRYKTALALMKERPDLEGARYRMLTFVNMSNPGLVILPTHRLVQNLEDFDPGRLLEELHGSFEVREFDRKEDMFGEMERVFGAGGHAFGLYMKDGRFRSMELRDISPMNELLKDASDELRKLDVSILHSMILDRILGIDKEKLLHGTMTGGGYVVYIKGIGDAVEESIRAVDGGAQCVFFMNPTRIEEVEAVSRNFECMPQKSTFFHPKVWTGFTINKL